MCLLPNLDSSKFSQMFFFLIACSLSLILFYKSLALENLPPWACETRLLSFRFWKDFSPIPITNLVRNTPLFVFTSRMSPKKKIFTSHVENADMISDVSMLDLPDLVLDCILEKLPPEGLCRMACVCVSMKDKCMSAHMWGKHMNSKWYRIVGHSAYREWRCRVDSRKGSVLSSEGQRRGLMGYLTRLCPFALNSCCIRNISKKKNHPQSDSIMSWYIALESGKFWFPAQVYNRENGHVGFVLSCYDAELSYDQRTDTFRARYPPHGRRASALETGITWDRLRAPPVDTPPHDLHTSDCLNNLQPGDHIEIQWRRNKDFPYGWWYGVVGHLETCDRVSHNCRCHSSDTLVLEFNHYARDSRWRRRMVSRKEHREEGNESDGFYGGIRKLCGADEISRWKKLWPAETLE